MEKYIYLEETQRATADAVRSHGTSQVKLSPKRDERLQKEPRKLRVCRYSEYASFNEYLADLYKEVSQAKRFPKPKALRVRAHSNRSLFCKYHNGFEHKTKDGYDF